jgi:hypothetical protein
VGGAPGTPQACIGLQDTTVAVGLTERTHGNAFLAPFRY